MLHRHGELREKAYNTPNMLAAPRADGNVCPSWTFQRQCEREQWGTHMRFSRCAIDYGGLAARIVVKLIGLNVLPGCALALVLGAAGCGTLGDGSRWGQDGFSSFDGQRIARAAREAFWNPNTLVPLAGAAVFAIDDFDERASDWAVEHNPVFGSESTARDASDAITVLLGVEVLATALARPSGDDRDVWAQAKLRGLVAEGLAIGSAQGATLLLKESTNRQRPDGHDNDSFPSLHSSSSFAFATLANRNLESIGLSDGFRSAVQVGNVVLATSVAWSRVEGRKHYPSDVLFGAALGHFFAAFFHDAFLDLPEDGSIELTSFAAEGGAGVQVSLRF